MTLLPTGCLGNAEAFRFAGSFCVSELRTANGHDFHKIVNRGRMG